MGEKKIEKEKKRKRLEHKVRLCKLWETLKNTGEKGRKKQEPNQTKRN